MVRKPSRPKLKWPKQQFVVSHLNGEQDFKSDGLRPYVRYRDLGMEKATGGMVHAHHRINGRPYKKADVSIRHCHDLQFQMIFILKGWIRIQLDGEGEHLMREGSCWNQPPGITHVVLGYSDDFEAIEIDIPAKFDTVNVA